MRKLCTATPRVAACAKSLATSTSTGGWTGAGRSCGDAAAAEAAWAGAGGAGGAWPQAADGGAAAGHDAAPPRAAPPPFADGAPGGSTYGGGGGGSGFGGGAPALGVGGAAAPGVGGGEYGGDLSNLILAWPPQLVEKGRMHIHDVDAHCVHLDTGAPFELGVAAHQICAWRG